MLLWFAKTRSETNKSIKEWTLLISFEYDLKKLERNVFFKNNNF